MLGSDIYFFHIPKTAGGTVWRFIETIAAPDKICPWWLWDQLIRVPEEDLSRWSVFRGHFLSHLEAYTKRKFSTFTLLRDPVERTVSHYCHVRRDPAHPSYSDAMRLSLAEFCRNPMTSHMVVNYQCAYLAKAPRDVKMEAQDITEEGLVRFELQERLQYPDAVDDACLLQRAKDQLARFITVGFTEQFDDSLRHISRMLGVDTPQPSERRNVNPDRRVYANLDDETLAIIREATALDAELYQFAKADHLLRRYSKVTHQRLAEVTHAGNGTGNQA